MTEYEKTEQAYKNGYAKGFEDGKKSVEVVRGRWAQCKDWDFDYECSVCGNYAGMNIDENYDVLTPYCPNCGAKMDGDGNVDEM